MVNKENYSVMIGSGNNTNLSEKYDYNTALNALTIGNSNKVVDFSDLPESDRREYYFSSDGRLTIGSNNSSWYRGRTIGNNNENYASGMTVGSDNWVAGDMVFLFGGDHNTIGGSQGGLLGALVIGNKNTRSKSEFANNVENLQVRGKREIAAGNPETTVSFGSKDNERQLVNVAAGRVNNTSTDAINGSQLQAVIDAVNEISITEMLEGKNISINQNGSVFTVSADVGQEDINGLDTRITQNTNEIEKLKQANLNVNSTTLKQGDGVIIDNEIVSINAGKGLSFDESGKLQLNQDFFTAGNGVVVKNTETGIEISAKSEISKEQLQEVIEQVNSIVDTNTQSITKQGRGILVEVADNDIGTKDYTISIKTNDSLTFTNEGELKIADDFIGGLQTTLSAGNGIATKENTNKNGGKSYEIAIKTDSSLDFNNEGDLKVSDNFVESLRTIVSEGKGILVKESTSENGGKDYSVAIKVGKGLDFDTEGALISTGINEIKGGKGIEAQTFNDGSVRVSLDDNVEFESMTIANGPKITKNGIDANNTRITNIAEGIEANDAVTVGQLERSSKELNTRIKDVKNEINRNKKRSDASVASVAAMANIPSNVSNGEAGVGVGVGVGYREGQGAIAIGYAKSSDNSRHIIKMSAGLDTQKKATVGAGYFYKW